MATFKSHAVGFYLHRGPALARGWHGFKRAITRAKRTLTFYYQTDDPYSHLLAQGLLPVFESAPELALEPVVVPTPAADADPEPQKRRAFAMRDCADLAAHTRVRFPAEPTQPAPDRVRRVDAVLLETRPPVEWLRRAIRLGDALWSDDSERLAEAVRDYGTVAGHTVRPRVEANYKKLRSAGHYMGGMIHYGGEWYWGLDRLALLCARLKREGVSVEAPEQAFEHLESAEAWSVDAPFEPAPREGERVPLDVWFSFRSPYSYIAIAEVERWVESMPIDLRLRPVLPMVTRGLPVPRQKVLYIAKDAKRLADARKIPFHNVADPLGEGVERCLAMLDHVEKARGVASALRFARCAYEGIWSHGVDVATPAGLKQVATAAGVSELIEPALKGDAWRARCEANRVELGERGLWGVPCFGLGEWSTWGQDRLWLVEGRIRAAL